MTVSIIYGRLEHLEGLIMMVHCGAIEGMGVVKGVGENQPIKKKA
jgi:hypothetical protein